MKQVIFQTGVNVLGFPTYVEHYVYKGESKGNLIKPQKKKWLRVIEKIVTQH